MSEDESEHLSEERYDLWRQDRIIFKVIQRPVSVDTYRESQAQSRPACSFTPAVQTFSRGTHAHTNRNSASNINTCQCKCEYIARQYMDTDISVQHKAHRGTGTERGRGRGRGRGKAGGMKVRVGVRRVEPGSSYATPIRSQKGDHLRYARVRYSVQSRSTNEESVYKIGPREMNQWSQMKRGRRTYVDQSEHLSHKFGTVCRRQRAVAVRMGMYGLNDRSARRRLDDRRRPISLHLRRGRC